MGTVRAGTKYRREAIMASIQDLYAQVDDTIHSHTPNRTSETIARLRGLVAEAHTLGQLASGDRPIRPAPQAHDVLYLAVAEYTTALGTRGRHTICFYAKPSALSAERAGDEEAERVLGADSKPYVMRTSIRQAR